MPRSPGESKKSPSSGTQHTSTLRDREPSQAFSYPPPSGAGSVPTDNLDLEFDRGHSDLSVPHSLVVSGLVRLPGDVVASGIAPATSGTFFSASGAPIDYDGDGILSGWPPGTERNEFVGPKMFNVDVRVEKGFVFGHGYRVSALVELCNLTNARHPLLINSAYIDGRRGPDFGSTRVPLPGREIQLGARVAF